MMDVTLPILDLMKLNTCLKLMEKSGTTFNGKTWAVLSMGLNSMESHAKVFEETKHKLALKYVENENGKLLKAGNDFKYTDENAATDMIKELDELLETTVTIQLEQVPMATVENLQLRGVENIHMFFKYIVETPKIEEKN